MARCVSIQSINAAADRRQYREKDMKSVKFNPLTSLVTAAALAIGLAGCGGSSSTVEETPPPPPPPMPEATGGTVTLIKAQQDALRAQLSENGDSAVLSIAAMGSVTRGPT